MSGTGFRALGRRGGLTTAATRDMRKVAAHARKSAPSSLEYWIDRVDPERELELSDREQRAHAAMRLYFSDLARRRKLSTADATNGRPRQAAAANSDNEVRSRVRASE
jgi:hypothetical protein